MTREENIVLIGMPGAGKSTVGVLLAKATGRNFLDTDVWIQAREGRSLQEILDCDGMEAFCDLEAAHVLDLDVRACVIATGGSVVYREKAMGHLAAGGRIVYLRLPFEPLQRRLTNLATRGVVMPEGQDFRQLFDERRGLYERWAEAIVDCQGKSQDEIATEIARAGNWVRGRGT